ncbi:unnamed protein product, partial [Symbiodinium microadriaticum]
MEIRVPEVGRPEVVDVDPYPEDEVMREFPGDGISTPDDEAVYERRKSEVSEAMLSHRHSGSCMSSSKSGGISQAFAQSLVALQVQQVSQQ